MESDNLTRISRRLYLFGYLGLPILWIILILYFQYSLVDKVNLSPSVKQDIHRSKIAVSIVSFLFLLWLISLRIWKLTSLEIF
ncbi:hypothetical protein GAYE_SCF24G4387 [Galdieria yellowstonensis]|uniref:Gamma-secretase subunit PEN-2 n=1 Tax=Galdieria yellowstonensis TaxID=3028027 RepID=A0AAV9IGX3_9RHOD|nr:hypothetical protein GAYE_SCF24G4387 [Galdieria yellowstonensis]